MNLCTQKRNQKRLPTKRRSNLSRNLAGNLLFLVCSSCAVNVVSLKELNDPIKRHDRMMLDVSEQLQWDTHRGEIIRDSVNVIDSVVAFLKAHDNYRVLIKVYYSNQLRKHIESANLMAFNLNNAFLKAGVSNSRLAYEIAYDKHKTYVFYEKSQKVKIFLNGR